MVGINYYNLDIETILQSQTQIPQFILPYQYFQKLSYLLKYTLLTNRKAWFKVFVTS